MIFIMVLDFQLMQIPFNFRICLIHSLEIHFKGVSKNWIKKYYISLS